MTAERRPRTLTEVAAGYPFAVAAGPVAMRRPAYDVVTAYAIHFVVAFVGLGVLLAVPLFAVGGVETGSRAADLLTWVHLLSSYVLGAVGSRYEPPGRLLARF